MGAPAARPAFLGFDHLSTGLSVLEHLAVDSSEFGDASDNKQHFSEIALAGSTLEFVHSLHLQPETLAFFPPFHFNVGHFIASERRPSTYSSTCLTQPDHSFHFRLNLNLDCPIDQSKHPVSLISSFIRSLNSSV